MGIIVLAVAVLPMLGVGGMQLYRAETPGPVKDTKLTPRITETAKALWYVYLSFTIACMLSYMAAGMGWFDALCHAFSTVAIGGFSTHDLRASPISTVRPSTSSPSFSCSPRASISRCTFLRGATFPSSTTRRTRSFAPTHGSWWLSPRWSLHRCITTRRWHSPGRTIIAGVFQAVSIATTTGFTTEHYAAWPAAIPVILIFASFIGGSAGSTAGGIKVIRCLLIYKQGMREIVRLVHPSAEIPVKLGNKAVGHRVVDAVWGFFSVYIIVFGGMMLLMMSTGLDQVTAFSAVAATLNNLGPGLGEVSAGFMTLSNEAKWMAVAGMLLGRLEIFTLLVLITPTFWRH